MKDTTKPMYFYSTLNTPINEKHKGARVTVAGIIIDKSLHLGVAKCRKTDMFEKKLGRTIALGRAYKKPKSVSSLNESTTKETGKFFVNCATELIKTL